MNRPADDEREYAARLGTQVRDILERRARLGLERNELEKAGKSQEAGVAGHQIQDIHAEELPNLERIVRDAKNATKDSRARAELGRILKKIGSAKSGVYTERSVNISSSREAELHRALLAAKTNSQRRDIDRELKQIVRDRAFFEKDRGELARQNEECRRQHREKKERKKIERLFRKLERNGAQEGT